MITYEKQLASAPLNIPTLTIPLAAPRRPAVQLGIINLLLRVHPGSIPQLYSDAEAAYRTVSRGHDHVLGRCQHLHIRNHEFCHPRDLPLLHRLLRDMHLANYDHLRRPILDAARTASACLWVVDRRSPRRICDRRPCLLHHLSFLGRRQVHAVAGAFPDLGTRNYCIWTVFGFLYAQLSD